MRLLNVMPILIWIKFNQFPGVLPKDYKILLFYKMLFYDILAQQIHEFEREGQSSSVFEEEWVLCAWLNELGWSWRYWPLEFS